MTKIRIRPVVLGLVKPHRGIQLGLHGEHYRTFCKGGTIEVHDDSPAIEMAYVEIVTDDDVNKADKKQIKGKE